MTTAKLANNAVATGNITDANVTAPKLASTIAGAGMVLTATALDSVNQTLDPVVCATTAPVNLVNGTFVAGATIDGITLTTGDRVLVKNQGNTVQNGIFIIPSTGAATRALDMATGRADQVRLNATVFVGTGTTLGQTTWRLDSSTATYPTAPTIATHGITFAQVQLSNSSISSSAAIVASKIAAGTFGAGTYSFAGSTVNVSSGTLTTSAAQNKIIFEGCASHLNIGSLYNLSAQAFLPTSDRNAKTNIKSIDSMKALENVRKMRGVKFDWKESGEPSAGVVAQDMESIAPELVAKNQKGEYSFNYDGLNGYLIPAIQMLASTCDELVKKCEDLEEEVDKLKRKRSRAMMSDSTVGDDEEGDQPLKAQPRLE